MNIPPDNLQNDLNRDSNEIGPRGEAGFLNGFVNAVIDANREWTDAKDFAVRLAVPLFSMAAAAIFNRYLEKRDMLLKAEETNVAQAKVQLAADRKAFEAERGTKLDRPVAKMVDELMARGNKQSYRALKEIDELQPLVEDVLKIKCSQFTSKDKRAPIEKEIRRRLLKEPSAFDGYGNLKAQMLEDTIHIYKADVKHCDVPWPLGNNNNGELYKIYKDNWRLRVELEKHKKVIEQLKHAAQSR